MGSAVMAGQVRTAPVAPICGGRCVCHGLGFDYYRYYDFMLMLVLATFPVESTGDNVCVLVCIALMLTCISPYLEIGTVS